MSFCENYVPVLNLNWEFLLFLWTCGYENDCPKFLDSIIIIIILKKILLFITEKYECDPIGDYAVKDNLFLGIL